MNDGLQSDYWYRVADLQPYLRTSTEISRHRYRGTTWYVMRDAASGENVRVNGVTHDLIKQLDGQTTLDQAWRALLERLGDDAPTQEDVIVGIAQLAEANLLQTDRIADLAQLRMNARRRRRREWAARINPLSFQVALFDPGPVVERLAPHTRWLLCRPFLWTLAASMFIALLAALVNADALGRELARISASGTFLFLMWLVYPLAKTVHEFAHALVARRFGAEVSEMGLRMLVLMPMPYVDASSASLLADKRERAAVAAAGIVAELAIATLAMFAWLLLEPGIVRDAALATLVITSISTVFFNGNPLLKFDGYYVLTDLLELPNLAQRARQYWLTLSQRTLLRLRPARPMQLADGERPWLIGYGAASWIYRLFLFFSIALLVAETSPAAGLLILLFGAWMLLLRPLISALDFLVNDPALNGRRMPAFALGGATVAALLAGLLVPLPANTSALGVVWLPEHAQVRAGVPGRIVRFLAAPDSRVRAGQPLVELRNEELEVTVAGHEATLRGLQAEYLAALGEGKADATLKADEIRTTREELADARERLKARIVRARTDGRFVVPRAQDMPGRWLDQGEPIAYLLGAPRTTVRVALPNAGAAAVRDRTRSVEVRFLESPGRSLPARLTSDSQSGITRLPSAALSRMAGGWIEIDPEDPEARSTLEPVFVIDVAIDDLPVQRAGQRAMVRFHHPDTPLLSQAHDLVRRLFLRHFLT
jgi:putative peptide zinc metalloprotease protein